MSLPEPLRAFLKSLISPFDLPESQTVLTPLGNCGGFSGARLWRGKSPAGDFCLKAWPAEMSRQTLENIHGLMERARGAGLDFVPAVLSTPSGTTCLVYEGRLWDVTIWMPGRADFHDQPCLSRLAGACTALGRLHVVWAEAGRSDGPCPAVRRRLEKAYQWQILVNSGWEPDFSRIPHLQDQSEKAWHLVCSRMGQIPEQLTPWSQKSFSLQPCLCDIWHDHVLFTGDTVSGLVDYGSVKKDNVAVDLARLLGSLVPDDNRLGALGLDAYCRVRPLSGEEQQLTQVLDETGTVVGLANWLIWLYHDARQYDNLNSVARRFNSLLQRLAQRTTAH